MLLCVIVEVLDADTLMEAPTETDMDSAAVDDGLGVLDGCTDGDNSAETEACNDSLKAGVPVESNVAEVEYESIGDRLGTLESEAAAEDVGLIGPEGDKLVVTVPVFELVKDWLGLDECDGVLELLEEALMDVLNVGVLELVEEAVVVLESIPVFVP